MQVVYNDMPLGYSASFPHFPPVFPSTLFSHPFSYSSSHHLPFRHPSFISVVSSSSPHHPPFFSFLFSFFLLPLFYHLCFSYPFPWFPSIPLTFLSSPASSFWLPLWISLFLPFLFPPPFPCFVPMSYPPTCLLFLLLHSSSLISPFPPPLHFSLPLFCTLFVSDFPIIFSNPAACTEL